MPSRRARSLPAAALVLDRVLKRLQPERVVFSALGLREGWLYAQLPQEERYRDPLVEGAQLDRPAARRACRNSPPALARLDGGLFPGETPAEARLRVAACALSDIAWRDTPEFRAEETLPPRCCSFRSSASSMPSACSSPPPSMPATTASPMRPGWRRRSRCSAPAPGGGRRSSAGRITLAYRLSGGMPEVLAGSRLRIEADCVRLEVGAAARVPDSEVVADRLKLLANAIGVKRTEIASCAVD